MKFLIMSALLLSSLSALAKPCKVYGISDGPQSLGCQFGEEVVQLTCQKGSYYLNAVKVDMAFHLETEEGPSPLVFKNDEQTLTVILENDGSYLAELERGQEYLSGTCR